MESPQINGAIHANGHDTNDHDRPVDLIAIQESALRQLALTDPDFEIGVIPLDERNQLWWRIVVRFAGYARELRLVDARLRDRRWKQLNALARFVCRSCGSDRHLTIDLVGVDPERLTTKGE
jgi:hypothetical protein